MITWLFSGCLCLCCEYQCCHMKARDTMSMAKTCPLIASLGNMHVPLLYLVQDKAILWLIESEILFPMLKILSEWLEGFHASLPVAYYRAKTIIKSMQYRIVQSTTPTCDLSKIKLRYGYCRATHVHIHSSYVQLAMLQMQWIPVSCIAGVVWHPLCTNHVPVSMITEIEGVP